MRWLFIVPVAVLVAGVVLFAVGRARAAAELKPGDPAPDFSLAGSDGRTHALADSRGKRAVVVAWFPKSFTGD